MSKKNNGTPAKGIGFCGLLTIVFITLKLLNVIDWSWWKVTFLLWGGFAALMVCWILAILIIYIVTLRKKAKIKKIRKNMGE